MALEYAAALHCERLHIMAGLDNEEIPSPVQHETYVENLAYAAQKCTAQKISALIEPINTKDMPCDYLSSVSMAEKVIAAVNHPNLELQFDIYHVQRTDGDIVNQFKRTAPLIGHIQIANPPDRFEPDNGEINYPYIFDMLEAEKYDGWIGREYKPSTTATETLGWANNYLTPKD